MKRVVTLNGNDNRDEAVFACVHEAAMLGPTLQRGTPLTVDEARHLGRILDKLETMSYEGSTDLKYPTGDMPRVLNAGVHVLALETPEHDLLIKFLELLVKHSRSGKVREVLAAFDQVKAAEAVKEIASTT